MSFKESCLFLNILYLLIKRKSDYVVHGYIYLGINVYIRIYLYTGSNLVHISRRTMLMGNTGMKSVFFKDQILVSLGENIICWVCIYIGIIPL